MGRECFPADASASAKQSVAKQMYPECASSSCAHRLVVGFDLKACHHKEDDNQSLRVNRPSEKQTGSTKSCRPTSGLESLFSSPRAHGIQNLQSHGAGIELGIQVPSERASIKIMAAGIPSQSDPHQKQTCAFDNICNQSHPIPIAHSPLREAIAKCASKSFDTKKSSSGIPSPLRRRCFEDKTQSCLRASEEVERSVFSLLTASPGTYEGAEFLSVCTRNFLEVCFLCKRHLEYGRDIFMYRGDKAFCSVECRQQQMVIDDYIELGKKYFYPAAQPRRSNHQTVSTAAAA